MCTGSSYGSGLEFTLTLNNTVLLLQQRQLLVDSLVEQRGEGGVLAPCQGSVRVGTGRRGYIHMYIYTYICIDTYACVCV